MKLALAMYFRGAGTAPPIKGSLGITLFSRFRQQHGGTLSGRQALQWGKRGARKDPVDSGEGQPSLAARSLSSTTHGRCPEAAIKRSRAAGEIAGGRLFSSGRELRGPRASIAGS